MTDKNQQVSKATHIPVSIPFSEVSEVRQAEINDLDLILEWTLKLHHHEDDNKLKMHQDFSKNLAKWLTFELENPNNLFLIASNNNQAVGFISASSVINDNGFLAATMKGVIKLLWIEESMRNNNIAKLLVTEVERCFESIGVTYIECNYTAGNALAAGFWQNNAYQPSSITAQKIISD